MHAVTCRTEGRINNGYTLILTDPGPTIICVPCGQPIKNTKMKFGSKHVPPNRRH